MLNALESTINRSNVSARKMESRRGLLKPIPCSEITNKCSTWLNQEFHVDGKGGSQSKQEIVKPVTWSESFFKVDVKCTSVDLICTRRKYHQVASRDVATMGKFLQVFGEESSQRRNFSKSPDSENCPPSYCSTNIHPTSPLVTGEPHTFNSPLLFLAISPLLLDNTIRIRCGALHSGNLLARPDGQLGPSISRRRRRRSSSSSSSSRWRRRSTRNRAPASSRSERTAGASHSLPLNPKLAVDAVPYCGW
jgi:hypothetical protein